MREDWYPNAQYEFCIWFTPHIAEQLKTLETGKYQGNLKIVCRQSLPSFPSRSKTLLIVTKHCRETDIKVLYPFHFCLISLLCPISFFPGFFTFTLKPYVDNFVTWHSGEIFEALYLTVSVKKKNAKQEAFQNDLWEATKRL